MRVELVDRMGSDLTVVNSARVSFDKHVTEMTDKDVRLIHYLAKHGHFTPFTHPQITLREEVPVFVARQRFKHMVGFTYNEVSRRYVDSAPEFFYPSSWRSRPEGSVKQGSGEGVVTTIEQYGHDQPIELAYADLINRAEGLYRDMLKAGVSPEQARMVLPQSMYTSYYVTGSLASFARAYRQRADNHAQYEIQLLAKEWARHIESLFPHSWKALTQ